MHKKESFYPFDASTLMSKERMDAIAITSVMFGMTDMMKIIVCHSVDGWKQHEYLKKEDGASPTVSTESVFITLSIEACEGRNVVTHDIH